MKFSVRHRIRGAVAHTVVGGRVLASRNYRVFGIKNPDGPWEGLGRLPVRRRTLAFSSFRLSARALRLGCSMVRETCSGALLAIGDRHIFRKDNRGSDFEPVHRIERGSRPLHRGVCVTKEGTILWGEYFGNNDRMPLHIYGSTDDARTFSVAHTFAAGSVRHVHGIQQDPHTGHVWIMTGDEGGEAGLYQSDSSLRMLSPVGRGVQIWRSVSLLFSPKHVFWGTDSPSEQNYIMRYERASGRLDRLQPVGGPVYYSAQNEAGMMFFATTVEVPGPYVAREAQVWVATDSSRFTLLAEYRKDRWHQALFQFGAIQFPEGLLPGRELWLSGTALKGIDNVLIIGTVGP